MGGACGPPVGWLVDRIEAHRVMLVGAIIVGVGFLAASRSDSCYSLLAANLLVAVGVTAATAFGGWRTGYVAMAVPILVIAPGYLSDRSRVHGQPMHQQPQHDLSDVDVGKTFDGALAGSAKSSDRALARLRRSRARQASSLPSVLRSALSRRDRSST